MLSDALADLQKKHFFKEALWQEASSHEGDEGLTGAMEFQILSQKVQVEFLMFSYVAMLSMFACLSAGQVLLQGSPMPDLVSGDCSNFIHLELWMTVLHTEELRGFLS